MKYRKLGATGLDVSILSYGASALGGVFSEINEDDGIQAVHTALDMGVNYIDVSPAYGDKKAETVLGRALKTRKREEYYLSTKAGKFCTPGAYGGHLFDYSEAAIRKSVDESLGRLGVEHVDVVYLHDIEYDGRSHVDQAVGEGIETLKALKSEGKIRFYGLSTYPMDLWKTVAESVDIEVAMTHSHYCLSDTQLLDIVDTCDRRGIGLINSSPLLMGVLTSRGPADWFPITEEEREVAQKAVNFCLENGTTIEKLSIQYAVANERIPTTLTSSSNPGRIRQSIENALIEPDLGLVGEVQDILKPILNRDWNFGETC
ncbi:aldo/keto reductase [Pelagicoccus mobilis]|uniref:Aldo/keto reductase n=1 Tax=Pelagicoccus mobilis TaxID=415221 RepID=A0A934VR32_9BACT|nr:aldo/keto reductase [Pelagicoccus mobilis]MBK1878977.1 aldo/keto reductase [Pelagicoccus mobilis]